MTAPLGISLELLRATHAAEPAIVLASADRHAAGELFDKLVEQGYQVVRLDLGREVLAIARGDAPPQLMIIDTSLPDAEGSFLCERLAQDPMTAAIPVILLSDMQRPDIIRRSRSGGCRYQVRRSYEAAAMLMLIQGTMDESRAVALS